MIHRLGGAGALFIFEDTAACERTPDGEAAKLLHPVVLLEPMMPERTLNR
jgi:hypothetical protein